MIKWRGQADLASNFEVGPLGWERMRGGIGNRLWCGTESARDLGMCRGGG